MFGEGWRMFFFFFGFYYYYYLRFKNGLIKVNINRKICLNVNTHLHLIKFLKSY